MRRFYPYLENQRFENRNTQTEKENYLSTISQFLNQKQYVRITLLNWGEEPIKEIQGEITSGSLTKDGSSSIRRTCNMSVMFSDGDYDVTDVNMDFSINKKIFVEIGIKNYTNEYKDYPILWFPQGVFFISQATLQNSTTSHPTLSLTLKDKMCGLNGDVGGKFPSAVILDSVDTQDASGQYVSQKVRVFNIIQELVHHYGGEPLENIIIEDVPLRIKRVVRWLGTSPLYIQRKAGEETGSYFWYDATMTPQDGAGWEEEPENVDIGYVYDDFVYTDDLTFNLGSSVADALESIKNYMGNYEYYYDVFGVFHFREIKNYLNTTLATSLLEDMKTKDYLADVTTGKTVYTFSDKNNIISITNTPKYDNIKNDYIIQGTRQGTSSNQKITVRYHLAIDNKPTPGNIYYGLVVYREADTNLVKLAFPDDVDTFSDLPTVGNFNIIYRTKDTNEFWYWDDDVYKAVTVIRWVPQKAEGQPGYTTKDWRTEIYIQGLMAERLGLDTTRYYNGLSYDAIHTDETYGWFGDIYRQTQVQKCDTDYYFEEIEAFWPQMYDLDHQLFYGEVNDGLSAEKNKALTDATNAKTYAQQDYDSAKKKYDDAVTALVPIETAYQTAKKVQQSYQDKNQEYQKKINDLNTALAEIQTSINNAEATKADLTKQLEGLQEGSPEYKTVQNNISTVTQIEVNDHTKFDSTRQSLLDTTKAYNDMAPDILKAGQDLETQQTAYTKANQDVLDAKTKLDTIGADLATKTVAQETAQSEYDEVVNNAKSQKQVLTDGNFYLDFIDPQSSGLGEYSVQNIGRRTDAVTDDDVNCLFQPEIPDIIWLEADGENLVSEREECIANGQPYSQLPSNMFQYLATGGYKNGAFDKVKEELWTHTVYQKTLGLTTIPVFYLEPNSRIRVNDSTTNTYGDYMVNSISFSLGPGNSMSINCSECLQKM